MAKIPGKDRRVVGLPAPIGAWGVPPNLDLNAIIDNGTTVQIGPGPDGQEASANSLTIGGTHSGSTLELVAGGTLFLNDALTIGNGRNRGL